MSKELIFYYDYGSPTSYLAWTQLPALAARTGAKVTPWPVLLGGVFKATGNRSPAEIEAKRAWMIRDLELWARHYGVPFRMNPYFIINTLALMRGAVAALEAGVLPAYDEAVFRAMWADARNLADPAEVRAVLAAAGLDAAALMEATGRAEIKKALMERTDEAVRRGVFGVPAFIVDDVLYFGQDRLHFVEAALAEEAP